MKFKALVWCCVFFFFIAPALAFFETPSNNIIVTNNLYNGSFNLSELNLDDLTVNGQLNLKENQISIYENGDNWTYSETGTVTGNMRIVFPYNSINFTAIIDVEGYDSAKANFWEGTIYATYNEVNAFTSGLCDAKISGETPFTDIIFKYNAPNPTIDLGWSVGSNSNPFWRIKKITFVGENSDLDWSGVYVTKNTVFGFGGVILSAPNFRVWSNDNDGVGSGLDADYFGGNVYTKYIYGNTNWGTFTNYLVSKNYNDVDRTGIYVGCTSTHCTNAPFTPTGTTYSYVLNLHSGISNAYNKQLGFSISENKMAMRTEYGEGSWSSWDNILTDDYTGNVNINGDITGNSFYTTNGAYEAIVYPDFMGIGTLDTTDYPNSIWFYNVNGSANGYSIGEGRDDKLRLVSGYDSADGSFIRDDFVMDENGNIEMGNNVTIGGNVHTTTGDLLIDNGNGDIGGDLVVDGEITTKGRKVQSNQYWSNEFLYYQYGYPWIGGALNGGISSQYTSLASANHPGNAYFRSTTGNANSGYSQRTLAISEIAGGEKTTGIFYIGANFDNYNTSYINFGFMNAYTEATATYGAYIDIVGTVGNITAYAKTINGAGSETINGTTASLPVSTWLRYEITVNDDATSVNYKITNSPATTTYLDVNITTNIPTSNYLYNVAKMWTTDSATPSSYMMIMDFIDLEINRVLAR